MVYDVSAVASAHVLASLGTLDRRIDRDMRRLLPHDLERLRSSHGRLLDLIGADGSRPSALAEGSWISKQAIGRRIKELEERGLVSVSADPTDARAVVVRRTAAGDHVRGGARGAIAAMEEEWEAAVGADRYATFRAVLAELGSAEPPGRDSGAESTPPRSSRRR